MDVKEKTGIMFANKNWTEGSNQPRIKGEIKIEGKSYEIAVWSKKSANNNTYYSVQLKEKEEYHKQEKKYEPMERTTYPTKPINSYPELDDDVPFNV